MRRKRLLIFLSVGAALALAVIVLRLEPVVMSDGEAEELQGGTQTPRTGTFALDCTVEPKPISPDIYGVGGTDTVWTTNLASRRWGGNPTTRYNWELNTWNVAKDWFFRNVGGANEGYDGFLDENLRRGVSTAFTIPTIGWVAKDGSSYSFPVSVYGAQQATAPELPDAGNGNAPNGKPIAPGPPTRTSTPLTPDAVERWVRAIREKDKTRGRSVHSYILDNEPSLWNSTHRDVHPDAVSYDELLERTIAYGSAIRRADPEGRIAGPAEWGWLGYHYSAKDITSGGVSVRADRRLHGDEALIPWYLRKLREHEQKTGTRVLDILDVHFYPMGDGIGIAQGGDTDPATAARRIRSTRSLWDPTYVDESWINEKMRVIPLMREWIARHYPGLAISIGEWNFGAETHISGGLATAEALGRFGVEGVDSAYYWTSPAENSASFWAFRAFRNFDGKGARFQDLGMPVKGDATLASVFASRDADRRQLVAILLNFAPLRPLTAQLSLQGCGSIAIARGFTYSGGEGGFSDLTVSATRDAVNFQAAPYSINVIDLGTVPAEVQPVN